MLFKTTNCNCSTKLNALWCAEMHCNSIANCNSMQCVKKSTHALKGYLKRWTGIHRTIFSTTLSTKLSAESITSLNNAMRQKILKHCSVLGSTALQLSTRSWHCNIFVTTAHKIKVWQQSLSKARPVPYYNWLLQSIGRAVSFYYKFLFKRTQKCV